MENVGHESEELTFVAVCVSPTGGEWQWITEDLTLTTGSVSTTLTCPDEPNLSPVGGGVLVDGPTGDGYDVVVASSAPSAEGGWTATVRSSDPVSRTVRVVTLCAEFFDEVVLFDTERDIDPMDFDGNSVTCPDPDHIALSGRVVAEEPEDTQLAVHVTWPMEVSGAMLWATGVTNEGGEAGPPRVGSAALTAVTTCPPTEARFGGIRTSRTAGMQCRQPVALPGL